MSLKLIAHIFLLVVIMLSVLSKALGLSQAHAPLNGATRYVDLSGNTFSFSMPENFSRDMPAAPLLESLDIAHPFDETLLIQRWWDIKEPGFFGSNLGVVMMTISLVPVPKNTRKKVHDQPYNIRDRVDLMQLVIETLHQRYKGDDGKINSLYHIPGLAYLFGPELEGEFRESIYHQQKWTSYSIGGPASQLIVNHVLPLTNSAYLEASFTYSPNSGVHPRTFREFAYTTTDLVEKSFYVAYASDNPLQQTVEEDWIDSTTNEALQCMRDVIIPRLFGPERLKIQKPFDGV